MINIFIGIDKKGIVEGSGWDMEKISKKEITSAKMFIREFEKDLKKEIKTRNQTSPKLS